VQRNAHLYTHVSSNLYIARMPPRPHPVDRSRPSRLRRLARPLVAPEVFDFWASRLNRTWSWSQALARIVARETASSDSVTLWLKPNRHVARLQPGQHIEVGVELDGRRVSRTYSPSLGADGRLAITVKRIAGGALSGHLCDVARVGDVLALGPVGGELVMPGPPRGEWLFLAAGSGITPLMSMLRALAAQGMPVPVTLVYWTSTRAQRCFGDELRALAAGHPNLRVRFALTREAAQAPDELEGRIAPGIVDALAFAAGPQVFACGPAAFVAQARSLYEARSTLFRSEAFTPPDYDCADSGEVSVTLARSGRTLMLPRGQSLLGALEAAGLKPAHGCRMGICNTCACGKREGAVRHLPSGAVHDAPMSALKLCIHSAVSPLVIDL
jgi:ferredoxin-NADP reductase